MSHSRKRYSMVACIIIVGGGLIHAMQVSMRARGLDARLAAARRESQVVDTALTLYTLEDAYDAYKTLYSNSTRFAKDVNNARIQSAQIKRDVDDLWDQTRSLYLNLRTVRPADLNREQRVSLYTMELKVHKFLVDLLQYHARLHDNVH